MFEITYCWGRMASQKGFKLLGLAFSFGGDVLLSQWYAMTVCPLLPSATSLEQADCPLPYCLKWRLLYHLSWSVLGSIRGGSHGPRLLIHTRCALQLTVSDHSALMHAVTDASIYRDNQCLFESRKLLM